MSTVRAPGRPEVYAPPLWTTEMYRLACRQILFGVIKGLDLGGHPPRSTRPDAPPKNSKSV